MPPEPPRDPAPPTLEVRDLVCRRGERVLFRGLRFALPAGGAVWLKGPDGSGKTSLLRVLAGLCRPERGSVWWGGMPAAGAPGYRAAMRYLGHASGLKDDLSVMESLALAAALHGLRASGDAIGAALAAFGLERRAQARVRTLSQGQRRRVAAAQLVLAPEPSLWLLDEPFDALDDDGAARLDALLADHQVRGGSVLLASHRPPAAALQAQILALGPG